MSGGLKLIVFSDILVLHKNGSKGVRITVDLAHVCVRGHLPKAEDSKNR